MPLSIKATGISFRRLVSTRPGLALGLAMTFIVLMAVAFSFTPAYAALPCPAMTKEKCFSNIANPCGIGCIPDNNGDMCTDQPGRTIVRYTFQGPKRWSVCNGKGNLVQSCGEKLTSCGKPTYYHAPGLVTGGGNLKRCDPVLKCLNPLFWKACSALKGSAPCAGSGNPIPNGR